MNPDLSGKPSGLSPNPLSPASDHARTARGRGQGDRAQTEPRTPRQCSAQGSPGSPYVLRPSRAHGGVPRPQGERADTVNAAGGRGPLMGLL